MIVFEMKMITRGGEPVYEEEGNTTDWWCKIETKEEEMVYDEFIEYPDKYEALWNSMVKHAGLPYGVKWGDDDIYGYLLSDEDMPDLNEKYKDTDGDVWKRI